LFELFWVDAPPDFDRSTETAYGKRKESLLISTAVCDQGLSIKSNEIWTNVLYL